MKRADAENARVIEKESTGAPSTRNKINKSGTKTAPSPRSRPLPRKRARDEEDSWSSTDSESEDDYPSPSNSPSISSQDEDDSDDDSDDGFTINIGTIPTRKSPPSRRPSARENELPLANTAPAAAAVAAPKTKLKINDGASSSRPIDVAVAAATTTAAKATTTTTKTRQRAAPTRNKAKKSSKVTKRANLPDGLLPPEVQLNTRHQYAPGEEPWRKLQQHLAIPVHDALDLSPSAVGIVLKCKQLYYRNYRAAEVSEAVRVSAIPATATVRPSRRPDRVTESLMKAEGGGAVNQGKCVGYVPGIQMSQRFYARAEMACMGVHLPPVAGIEIAGKDVTGLGIPLALSIVVAGCYEDDADDGIELIFTGEGGNNLLGDKKQIGSQREVRGNAALVGNIRLGVPVRVTRKNRDPYGKYGCVLIFDGLYDVVEYWKVKGKEGFDVIQFRLIRRPGQGGLPSETVKFGGISAPKKLVPLSRPGIVDVDISGGKESLPIAAVNTTDDNDLPPCTALERVPLLEDLKAVHRGITNEALYEPNFFFSFIYFSRFFILLAFFLFPHTERLYEPIHTHPPCNTSRNIITPTEYRTLLAQFSLLNSLTTPMPTSPSSTTAACPTSTTQNSHNSEKRCLWCTNAAPGQAVPWVETALKQPVSVTCSTVLNSSKQTTAAGGEYVLST